MSNHQVVLALLLALSAGACGDGDDTDTADEAAAAAAGAPVEDATAPETDVINSVFTVERPIAAAPLLRALPADTLRVLVVADARVITDIVDAADRAQRDAMTRAWREMLGVDLGSPGALEGAGVDPRAPIAIARIDERGDRWALVGTATASAPSGPTRRGGARWRRDGDVVVVAAGDELGETVRRLTEVEGEGLAGAVDLEPLPPGRDALLVATLDIEGLGPLVATLTVHDEAVLFAGRVEAGAPATATPVEDWIDTALGQATMLCTALGVDDEVPEAGLLQRLATAEATSRVHMVPIGRTARHLTGTADLLSSPCALGGSFALAGPSEGLEKACAKRRELTAERREEQDRRCEALAAVLEHNAVITRVDGRTVELFGALAPPGGTSTLITAAIADWRASSDHSDAARRIARLDREVERIRETHLKKWSRQMMEEMPPSPFEDLDTGSVFGGTKAGGTGQLGGLGVKGSGPGTGRGGTRGRSTTGTMGGIRSNTDDAPVGGGGRIGTVPGDAGPTP